MGARQRAERRRQAQQGPGHAVILQVWQPPGAGAGAGGGRWVGGG
jgi:hypothetical protein